MVIWLKYSVHFDYSHMRCQPVFVTEHSEFYNRTYNEFKTLKILYFVIEKCMRSRTFQAVWVFSSQIGWKSSLSNFLWTKQLYKKKKIAFKLVDLQWSRLLSSSSFSVALSTTPLCNKNTSVPVLLLELRGAGVLGQPWPRPWLTLVSDSRASLDTAHYCTCETFGI